MRRLVPLDPWIALATCGGIGWIPFAPGTFGSLAGIPVSLAAGAVAVGITDRLPAAPPLATLAVEAALLAVVCAAGVPICTRAAAALGRGTDPGMIVLDEAAALPLVMLVVPPADRTPTLLATAFVLFRIFDIAKPPPCSWAESLPTGLGIMADDWAAAAWAAACLVGVRWAVAAGGFGG